MARLVLSGFAVAALVVACGRTKDDRATPPVERHPGVDGGAGAGDLPPEPATPSGGRGGAGPVPEAPSGARAGYSSGGAGADSGAAGETSAAGMASSAAGAGGTPEEAPELTATEREWASWPMPSWAGSGLPNQPHYSPLDDGTVRDDVTGLVWSTTRIAPTAWSFALEACAAGFRLPTIIELISIGNPETSRFDDAFELRAQSLWSASPVFGDATSAWLFYGGEGSTYPWQASQRYPAICVRPGTPSRLPHYEQTRIGSVAAVRDNWTGLVWQQGTSPRTYQFAEGQSYCATVAVGFRTPSIKELQTLIDRGRPAPTIDPAFFPDTPIARFWSSTTRGEGGSTAYLVELEHGSANTYSVDLPGYMRCVR